MNSSVVQVFVITGTSRGLGRSLAEYYLSRGFVIAGCSRGEATIKHPMYHHTTCNVAEEKAVVSWVRGVSKEFGRIDVLICNAGLVRSALFLSVTPGALMESFLQTNIAGVFYAMREVSKVMVRKGGGRIVAISSTMVALHEEGTAVYSATKSAITEMTRILAKELAPRGITCNVVAPGIMWTESSKELAKSLEWKDYMLKRQTIPRVLRDEEICNVTDFFISPLSTAVTGQVIYLGVVH